MKNTALFILAFLMLFSCKQQRSGQEEQTETQIEVGEIPPMTDREIEDMLIRSMINNRLQIALARQAKDKSDNVEFQAFCETLINDHEEFQYNISRLALSQGIEIPQGLTLEAQAEFDRLSDLPDEEFDKAFMELILKQHEEDLERYERLMAEERDDLQRGTLEIIHDKLKIHMDYAQQVNGSVQEAS